MASTQVLSGLELTKWRKNFVREFVRDTGLSPYMGNSVNDIIHVYRDLTTDGYALRVPIVARLKGSGVSGNTRLSGSEEQLDQYYQDVNWEFYRNAIEISKKERHKSAVDLVAVRRPLLKEWASELIKYQLIDQFHTIDGTVYASASEASKDTWVANNSDRLLFGAAVGNHSGNDHSAALANIDSTNDKLSPAMISLAKRRARSFADPHIRPFRTGTKGREYYVMFAHPLCFRDLKENSTMQQANREARARDVDSNPIFQDGDLIYDGVIVREIPEFYQSRTGDDSYNASTHLAGVGASSIDVGVNFLCGAQSIIYAQKQDAMPITKKEDDYNFFSGVGIEMAHGIAKCTWANGNGTRKDMGMMTVYASATADA